MCMTTNEKKEMRMKVQVVNIKINRTLERARLHERLQLNRMKNPMSSLNLPDCDNPDKIVATARLSMPG